MNLRVVVDNDRASLRGATPDDAPELLALVAAHLEEGHLLPRTLSDLVAHAPRFVVAARGSTLVGCAELAPLSSNVAEVRSLVVRRDSRGLGIAPRMVETLARRARREGFHRLCALAHDAAFFVRLGFSIVPHTWVPEKIAHDCASCPLFRACAQQALILPLDEMAHVRRGSAAGCEAQVVSHAH